MNLIFNIKENYIQHLYLYISLNIIFFIPSVLCFSFLGLDSGHQVNIKSTSPVTLDTPIWFTAELYPYEKGTYSYVWEDVKNHDYYFKDKNQGPISKWSVIYSSHEDSHAEEHIVSVTVYKYAVFQIAKNYIKFEVSNHLNGKISVVQPNVTILNPNYISTLNVTNFTAVIHDPNGWIRNHTEKISFYWQLNYKDTRNDTILGPCFTPSLVINITTPGDYFIQSNIILHISDQPVTTTTTTTTTTTPTTTTSTTTTPKPILTTTVISPTNNDTDVNITQLVRRTLNSSVNKWESGKKKVMSSLERDGYICDGWWNGISSLNFPLPEPDLTQSYIKFGFFFQEIEAREPMQNFNVSGTTWLRHGEVLNLKVKCSGVGPFFYCFNITYGSFNKSDPKICNESKRSSECGFNIKRYLKEVGTYTLVIKLYNDVSQKLERMSIIVYNVDRKPQLLHIIIPVACSLVAIIIIIYGIANFIQNKHRFSIEVADFDFCASEETEYKSFMQQLKEALAKAFSADVDISNREYRHRKSQTERPLILEEED